jgi:putative CocE/NonD family hydrolase
VRLRNETAANPSPPEQLAATVLNGSPAFIEDENGPFWSSRLGLQYLAGVRIPVMFTTDLYDFVPGGMYLAYEHTPAANAWLSTAFGHNSPAAVSQDDSVLGALAKVPIHRFIEKYLFGEGGDDPPRVRLTTNLGSVSGYERAEVLVRDESDWPLPSTRWTRLYLDGGKSGSAQSLNDGRLVLDPPAAAAEDVSPLASVTGPHGEMRTELVVFSALGAANAALPDLLTQTFSDDLRLDEAIGLTYTTPALAEDIEITGPVVLMVRATTTAPDFDWQVRLTDVHPDGRSTWITDGQLRASLRRVDDAKSVKNSDGDYIRPWLPFTTHEPVPIGDPVDYVIELAPTSNVFRAGDRIRLDIQPILEGYVDSARSVGLGALVIARGGVALSRLVLPVIPARCQLGTPAFAATDLPTCGNQIAFLNGSKPTRSAVPSLKIPLHAGAIAR